MGYLFRASDDWQPLGRQRRRVRTVPAVPAVLAGLDFNSSAHEFGQRTGLDVEDIGLAASTLLNINVFADAGTMSAPLFSYTETTGSNGQLTRKTHASLVAGSWYRVIASNEAGTPIGGWKRIQAS